MRSALTETCKRPLDGQRRLSGGFIRWARLIIGLLLIWIFMFLVAPAIEETPGVKPLSNFIRETGIDASALYYTEIEETAEAEMYLHNAETYPPVHGKWE